MRKKPILRFLICLAFLAFSGILIQVDAQTIKKGPYLIFGGDNTQMQVLWQDDLTAVDFIRWGTDQNMTSGPASSAEYGTGHQHRYILTGLVPGTKYYYQVQIGAATYNGSFTAAPPASATSLKFFAYGDTRTNTVYHDQVAQQVNSTYTGDPSCQTLIVSMGDLVSAGYNEDPWNTEFFNYSYPNLMTMLKNLPYMSCIGNHELSGTSTLFTKYFPYAFAGARYYSFDYGPAHFTVIDQYTTYTAGSAQYNWIVNDLAGSAKPWKFVYFHEPGWSADGGHENNTTVQNVLEPLFEQYNVAMVFAGHNHYYARAVVPKTGGGSIQHLTAGAAGAPLYTPNLTYPYIVAASSNHHVCRINIVNDNLLHCDVISNTGAILDNFTIERTTPPAVTRYVPKSVNISQGTLNSGTYASLATNNSVYYAVNSTTVKPRVSDWYGSFTITEAAGEVTRMTVTYDGKFSRAINQVLYLYNFTNGSWVQIDSRNVSTKDITITSVQDAPARFISATGEVRCRVYGSNTSKNFISYGDFMEVAVETAGAARGMEKEEMESTADRPCTGDLVVHPNPAASRVKMSCELNEPVTLSISIYSMMGEKVVPVLSNIRKETGTAEESCDISNLPSGIYVVVLTGINDSGAAVKKAQKLVISR